MEKVIAMDTILFNSLLETGVRAVVFLNQAHPMAFDLIEMTWLDYLIVHTGDIGGPDSIHPDLPYRSGELLVRRTLIKDALDLMRRLHLITLLSNEKGIQYVATEQSYPFIKLLETSYNKRLIMASDWLVQYILINGLEKIHELITNQIGKWNIEFQTQN